MPGLIITNPVHIEYLLEHGTVNLAVSLGLDTCPLCSHFGSVTVLQDDSPTAILHAFAGTADCLETRTCHHCFDEGLGDPPEEGEPGLHTPCQRCYLCALQGKWVDEQTGEAHRFTCACSDLDLCDED